MFLHSSSSVTTLSSAGQAPPGGDLAERRRPPGGQVGGDSHQRSGHHPLHPLHGEEQLGEVHAVRADREHVGQRRHKHPGCR